MEMGNDTNITLFLNSSEKTVYDSCRHIPESLLFYMCTQYINMFMGIPTNIMVMWLIRRNRSDSSTSDIFIWHLALLDTIFCLSSPMEMVNMLYLISSSTSYVLRFFYGIKDSSPLFLACICLDRYMAVLHPIIFSNLKDQNHRPVCAGVIWFITLVYAILKGIGIIPFEKVFLVMILTTFVFMVFCNISILWALKKSGPGRDEMHPVKKRAFKMVLIILAIIVFNYLPPVALFPFKSYFSLDVFNCHINFIIFGFMDISSSIQPVLYLSSKKLQCPSWCHVCYNTKDTKDTGNTTESSTVFTVNE